MEIDLLKESRDIVKSVLPPPEEQQTQVDLCAGYRCNLIHLMQPIRMLVRFTFAVSAAGPAYVARPC